MASTFTAGTSLATALTTESLLFASFSFAVSMMLNTRSVRRQVIPDRVLIWMALVGLAGVATAAGASWFEILAVEGLPRPAPLKIGFFGVLAAIIVQPFIAFFVALSMRD